MRVKERKKKKVGPTRNLKNNLTLFMTRQRSPRADGVQKSSSTREVRDDQKRGANIEGDDVNAGVKGRRSFARKTYGV